MLRRTAAEIDSVPPPNDAEPVRLRTPRRSAMGSVIGHTGFNVARYHITHVFGGLFPLLAGMLLFGWRTAVSVTVVVGSTLIFGFIWRRIGVRGHPLRPAQLLWLGLVLALMLPADLLRQTGKNSPWPILPSAGILVVIVCWSTGGIGSGRFHPAVVAYLLLSLMFSSQLTPQSVLQHNRMLLGDIINSPRLPDQRATQISWRKRPVVMGQDTIRSAPPAQTLGNYTRHETAQDGSNITLDVLLRERLPPMEDFVLGAVPGGMGTTSAVAVIIGGLFLLYRGLIDFRIPLLITFWAWAAMLVLPIPLGEGSQMHFRWFPGHVEGVGWAMAVTLANYQVLASPLLFTAFFLAGSPTVRPLTRKGRTIYAMLIGLLAATFQLYISVSLGSYLALLPVGFMTFFMDRCLAQKPLV